ncbi:MAG: lipoyl synthase [Myxococcota bacterium]|nr:lipoyl synthase [Myxococcota bacterium]
MSELVQIDDPTAEKPTPRLHIEKPTRKREPGPRPDWLKVKYRRNQTFSSVESLKTDLNLVTVCEEARCPNIDECWSAGTATFMLMGEICTRRCGFCAVTKGKPNALDKDEPTNTALAIHRLGVKHAVITSVNRDELPDGGAGHFAETVRSIQATSPKTRIELLVPDFLGDRDDLQTVLDAKPDVVAHNTETVPRLYRRVRPNAIYQRSLDVIQQIADSPSVSKTGLMLGLGETDEEVEAVMYDLRDVGCEILSLGQYLSPTTRHLAVERWVAPDTFDRLAAVGEAMGFLHVEAGPMVRSSYMAHRAFDI